MFKVKMNKIDSKSVFSKEVQNEMRALQDKILQEENNVLSDTIIKIIKANNAGSKEDYQVVGNCLNNKFEVLFLDQWIATIQIVEKIPQISDSEFKIIGGFEYTVSASSHIIDYLENNKNKEDGKK